MVPEQNPPAYQVVTTSAIPLLNRPYENPPNNNNNRRNFDPMNRRNLGNQGRWFRCGKTGHISRNCRGHFDITGKPLPPNNNNWNNNNNNNNWNNNNNNNNNNWNNNNNNNNNNQNNNNRVPNNRRIDNNPFNQPPQVN